MRYQIQRMLPFIMAAVLAVACLTLLYKAFPELKVGEHNSEVATSTTSIPASLPEKHAESKISPESTYKPEASSLPEKDAKESEAEEKAILVGKDLSRFVVLSQYPELANGCEVTCLAAVLQFEGYVVGKVELANDYLPKSDSWYGADPEQVYMGYPDERGWYCMPGPVVAAAQSYLAEQGSGLAARDISQASLQDILAYVETGTPVITWVTVGFETPRFSGSYSWELNGEGFTPYINLHCVVVTGYGNGNVRVADPMGITEEVSEELFTQIYTAMGSRAVVLQ